MNYTYTKYYKTSDFIFDDTDPFDHVPKKLDVKDFLKNEFLNCDTITFSRFTNLYRKLYGTPAKTYLLNTFESWKSGSKKVSEQTMSRIIVILPRLLSVEKRFYMLSCEVKYYLGTMQYYHQSKTTDSGILGINSLFINYYHKVRKFDVNRMSWFVSKNIFTEAEVEQFLSVCFCAIRKQLDLHCGQVFNDLQLLKNKLAKYNVVDFSGTYYISFLDTLVDISDIRNTPLNGKQFEDFEPDFSGRFMHQQELYFFEETRRMDYSRKQEERNTMIKANDIDMSFGIYQKGVKNKQEIKIASSLEGEGGVLSINLIYTPIISILERISTPSLKIVFLLVMEFTFLYLWFTVKSLGSNVLGFYGGLIIIILLGVELFRFKNTVSQLIKNG